MKSEHYTKTVKKINLSLYSSNNVIIHFCEQTVLCTFASQHLNTTAYWCSLTLIVVLHAHSYLCLVVQASFSFQQSLNNILMACLRCQNQRSESILENKTENTDKNSN